MPFPLWSMRPISLYRLRCLSLAMLCALFGTAPVHALSDGEVDSLLDEGERMQALMVRMQTQLGQPALAGALRPTNSARRTRIQSLSPWAPMSAMLESSLRERWFQSIERGVLGVFSQVPSAWENEGQTTVPVGFVRGEESPWYGALQVHSPTSGSGVASASGIAGVRARLAVAPTFEDGSFLHFGVSFHSMDTTMRRPELAIQDPEHTGVKNFSRALGVDLGYVQGDYAVQAQYLTSTGRDPEQLYWGSSSDRKRSRDGFYISGAWRLSGEQTPDRYAPGLLTHLQPRDEEGVWDVVVRYANLGESPSDSRRNPSGSMALGVHWRANPTFALELDFVEGSGESLDLPFGSDLSLRGVFSF